MESVNLATLTRARAQHIAYCVMAKWITGSAAPVARPDVTQLVDDIGHAINLEIARIASYREYERLNAELSKLLE